MALLPLLFERFLNQLQFKLKNVEHGAYFRRF